MLHIAGIRNCNKIRDTKKWMEEHDVEFEFIDIKKTLFHAMNSKSWNSKWAWMYW